MLAKLSLKVQERNILKDPFEDFKEFVDRVHTPNFSSLFLKVYTYVWFIYTELNSYTNMVNPCTVFQTTCTLW